MRGVVDRVTDTPTHPAVVSPMGRRRKALPRTGLLLYLGRPNSDEYLIGEATEIGEDTYIWGFHTGSDETIRAATGWTMGNANPFYDAAGDPVVVWASEILAWADINTANVLFKSVSAEQQTGKLAIYAPDTSWEILEKAVDALKIYSTIELDSMTDLDFGTELVFKASLFDTLTDGDGNVLIDASGNILITV